MKARLVIGLVCIAVLLGSAALFGIAATTGHADPNLPNVPPHRHWINGVQVGPGICDNPGDPGIQQAFNEFTVVPPGMGICHQVNLEHLSRVVQVRDLGRGRTALPDTLVGTDSHTTMINGLGVLGWLVVALARGSSRRGSAAGRRPNARLGVGRAVRLRRAR